MTYYILKPLTIEVNTIKGEAQVNIGGISEFLPCTDDYLLALEVAEGDEAKIKEL